MYPLVLGIHSLLRWAVLAAGAAAFGRAIAGARAGRDWTPADARAGRWFTIALDVQFAIGLVLYAGLSPLTQLVFEDFGAAMRTPALRFWAIEHLLGMTTALALVHVGRVRIRKAADAAERHRRATVFFGLTLLAMILTIPWPGMPAGRPLFRTL
ncbi:MAG: hypothetical protein A3F70_10510 [Acidobacteria bacterium RIFCSPLOWO2_12_FULL_67_14]|nr:MAG: hypothetical protein A3H29_04320 [Acidobacteria bacterium RIFCSPLOWO2_02_FULL_67_21]OFW38156.1 MAG: hypothetical protein A3F70_10510 [Acidobacteria bacterium RIFCSPLOWO2_12_FULL_67_14]